MSIYSSLSRSLLVVAGAGLAAPVLAEFRTIDGFGNNIVNPNFGRANTPFVRLTPPAYQGGLSIPRGGDPSGLPSARAISNAVVAQSGSLPNSHGVSDWFWQWGQFLDHDITLGLTAEPAESFNIPVPSGDVSFDPTGTGTQQIRLDRTHFTTDISGVRQQDNSLTAYIDASQVYGSNITRANDLRAFDGHGRLRTSVGGVSDREVLLPLNLNGLFNFNESMLPDNQLFIAGDVRSNEQVGLTAAHTLFVREHNRLATVVDSRLDNPVTVVDQQLVDKFVQSGLGLDEFIYQAVRKVVGAQIQKITYEDWLPLMLGSGALPQFSGYDDSVNAGIGNEFATAAFRLGHTLLSPQLLRMLNDGTPLGAVALRDAFFNPDEIKANGVDTLLLGLASQVAQDVDTFIVDDVRNFLFGQPGAGGFDLASLNIQRGREHGLPGLNGVRAALGLGEFSNFLELTGGDQNLADAFASVYASIADVDLWVGGLAEASANGGLLGDTFTAILLDQFLRLRDGDRFFFLDDLGYLNIIDGQFMDTSLADIIMRNSPIDSIQANAFLAPVPLPASLPLLLFGLLGVLARRRPRK